MGISLVLQAILTIGQEVDAQQRAWFDKLTSSMLYGKSSDKIIV